MKMKKRITECQIMRRKLVVHGTLTIGGETQWAHSEWVEEICGTPLFGREMICKSCADGWTDAENYMLDTEENKLLLKKHS